jgi:hypothetical protein
MRVRFFLAAVALVLPLTMKAQSFTYTYTGSAFNFSTVNNQIQNPPGTVAAPYSTSDSVTGNFTISGPIDNLNNAIFFDNGAFSFTDGVQTLSNTNGADLFAEISTDGSGNITSYSIGAQSTADLNDFITIGSFGSPGSFGKFDTGTEIVSAGTNTFGTMSAPAATPEPSSLALLGSGLAGLAIKLRRRMRRL